MLQWVLKQTREELTREFCRALEQRRQQQAKGQPLAVALTGGESARAFYQQWAQWWKRANLPSDSFSFYWSDERLVPPDNPDSNYLLARQALLEPAGVPAALQHRMPTDGPATACAQRYVKELESTLGKRHGLPSFPVLILGLGADGHTASLFPQFDPYFDDELLVRAADATADHPHQRLTFTPSLINAAEEVWFLITGEKKALAVERLLERNVDVREQPSLAVDPSQTHVRIFVDGSAGARILDRVVAA